MKYILAWLVSEREKMKELKEHLESRYFSLDEFAMRTREGNLQRP